jgi:hypothetical protein
MKKLEILSSYATLEDFINVYNTNKKMIGYIAVRKDVYANLIKILCIFPLKDKKLNYFLNLSPIAKTGYMSSYIMKIAKKVNVNNSIIEYFQELKEISKQYNSYQTNPENVAELLKTDIKKFINEFSYGVKKEVYKNELSKMTNKLCSAIFEQYDKMQTQKIKE